MRSNILLEKVNYYLYRRILCFCSGSCREVFKLMLVCKRFHAVISKGFDIWICLLKTLPKKTQEVYLLKHPNIFEEQNNNVPVNEERVKEIREFVITESKKKIIK